jgi:hypothetical protein
MELALIPGAQLEFLSGKILTLTQEEDESVPGLLASLADGFYQLPGAGAGEDDSVKSEVQQLGTLLATERERGLKFMMEAFVIFDISNALLWRASEYSSRSNGRSLADLSCLETCRHHVVKFLIVR